MSESINPYAQMRAIAAGDVGAMRLMAREAGLLAANGDEGAMFEALLFARLAYAKTGAPEDAGPLVAQLAFGADTAGASGEPLLQSRWEAEAIALLSKLAEDGEALADDMLPGLVASASAETATRATEVRQVMEQAAWGSSAPAAPFAPRPPPGYKLEAR